MSNGAKLKFKAADWLELDGQERSMCLAVSLLLQEGGAPHVSMAVAPQELRFDVRHIYHRASKTEGPRLRNIMLRLFLLYPARNGVEIFSYDASGPDLVVKRGAVDWAKALADWEKCGAVGKNRTLAKVMA